MFILIKLVLILLLTFSESLATSCLSLNDEPFMVKATNIDLIPLSLNIIHSGLVQINVVQVVMSYRQKFFFRKKQKT